MTVKIINGVKYVEYKELRRQTVRFIIHTAFIMAIIYASYSMIIAINVLLDNKEIIQKDALIYGMGLHNFSSCLCLDNQGREWTSTETGFLHKEYGSGWVNYSSPESQINFSNIEVITDGTNGDS